MAAAFRGFETQDSQWFQFLPFSIGDSVLSAAAPSAVSGDIGRMLLQPVALGPATLAVAIYLVGALVLAMAATERAEIA